MVTNSVNDWSVWISAGGAVLAGVSALIATVVSLWIARKDRQIKQLIADRDREIALRARETEYLISECHRAVRDLQGFRKLESVYASELAQIKGVKAEPLRIKMRQHEQIKEADQIGEYGQPNRIRDLLRRLNARNLGA